jgi:membrane associated rhomboid family serine protease
MSEGGRFQRHGEGDPPDRTAPQETDADLCSVDCEVALPSSDDPDAARGRARAWSLVLEARGIPHRLYRRGGRSALLVPSDQRTRAEEELRLYEAENRFWPSPSQPEPPTLHNGRLTFAVLTALGLFHDLTVQPPGRVFGIAVEWHRLGAMDAGRVLDGEVWRAVTALTLHSDGLHLASNFILGGILLAQLNRQVGVGLGVALAVTAGTLGNLTNALVRPPTFMSVGASTAVFGVLGALVALAAGGTARRDWRRWVMPLGAGAGLIAFTGVGGERTDYLAHLFGFCWGLVAGMLTQWPRPLRRAPGWKASAAVGAIALAVVVGAWAMAILPH